MATTRPFWTKLLYGLFALIPFCAGVYVLIEKKIFIGGRLSTGAVYEYEFPANIVMAFSFFLFTFFIIAAMFESKHKKRICEISFLAALILFFTGTLM